MNKLKFKTFTWPENPERFSIYCLREPVYVTLEDKSVAFSSMGPLKRTISGSGAFVGSNAYTNFTALAALAQQTTPGQLIHPTWGTISAYLTELTLTQEPKENYVAYTFTFREANSSGAIPK